MPGFISYFLIIWHKSSSEGDRGEICTLEAELRSRVKVRSDSTEDMIS